VSSQDPGDGRSAQGGTEADGGGAGGGAAQGSGDRCVLLFNTWADVPPTLPPPNAPVGAREAALLARAEAPLRCQPRGAWRDAARHATGLGSCREEGDGAERAVGNGKGNVAGGGVPAQGGGAGYVRIQAPLLGDPVRRGCAAPALSASADAAAVDEAFTATATVTSVALHGGAASAEAASAEAGDNTGGEPTLDEAEEIAMRFGFAEQMEADFWGVAER